MAKTVLLNYTHNKMIYPHPLERFIHFSNNSWCVQKSCTLQKRFRLVKFCCFSLQGKEELYCSKQESRIDKKGPPGYEESSQILGDPAAVKAQEGWKPGRMFGMGLLWYRSYDVTTSLKTLLAFNGTNPISKSLFWRDFEDMRQISSNVHYFPAFSNQVSPRFSCFGPLSWGQVDGDRHGIGEVWKLGSFFGFVSQRLSDSSSLGERSDRKDELNLHKEYCVKDLVVSCVHGRSWLLFQNISLKSESLLKTFEVFVSMRLLKFHS